MAELQLTTKKNNNSRMLLGKGQIQEDVHLELEVSNYKEMQCENQD